jgi:hypothetical protein
LPRSRERKRVEENAKKERKNHPSCLLWSISQAFYDRICANILAPKKVQTSNVSTKKLWAKLLHKKAVCKMLVKLTPGLILVTVDVALPTDFKRRNGKFNL